MTLIHRVLQSLQGQERKSVVRHACQALGLAAALFVSLGEAPSVASESIEGSGPDDPFSPPSLCDWRDDYAFFVGEKPVEKSDSLPCEAISFRTPAKDTSGVPNESLAVALPPDTEKAAFEEELRTMLAGYPIAAMAPAIAHYDRDIAGLIVGIAKKESNWGKRVPLDTAGDDCFNYWGYKGAGARGIAMGHGCFGTAEEAVQAIGKRLQELVALRQTSEPKNMTIWKCGSSCATHSPESVRKWVSDVDIYFRAIARK